MPARAYHSTGRIPPPWGEKLLTHHAGLRS